VENSNRIFYRPDEAWAADFIPFFKDGVFHLFYLLDWRDPARHGEGTPWYKVCTKDFVHFEEHGEMLGRGGSGDPDPYVFTGSVIEAGDRFHIFYTGHDREMYDKKDPASPAEAVMHAVSEDLEHWTKIPADSFRAPVDGYEPHDWRDPFVFETEPGRFAMLLAARRKGSGKVHCGCTALCTSSDLQNWHVEAPFWEPRLFYTHECPDLFRIGDWYYHVFSEFSDRNTTRYRMSRSLRGPWIAPADDQFDGRAYYAAKTASDGTHRYLFGWTPTREGDVDTGTWQWGGELVVHELKQSGDGTLSVSIPDSVRDAFVDPEPLRFAMRPDPDGPSSRDAEAMKATLLEADGCGRFWLSEPQPSECYRIDVRFRVEEGLKQFGLVLNGDWEEDGGYAYRVDPCRQSLSFGYSPDFPQNRFDSRGCERPVECRPDEEVHLVVLVQGDVCVAYWNGRTALSARMCGRRTGRVGFSVREGAVRIEEATIRSRKIER
jgi:beta-fructofuranosidase